MVKYTSTMMRGLGQHGTTTPFMRGYRKKSQQKTCEGKENEKVDWMETKDRRANNGFRKKVMEKNGDTEDHLAIIQRNLEKAAGKVAHHTKAKREKVIMSTPDNVRLREEAAVRCTAKIKRKVLKKRARNFGGIVKNCTLIRRKQSQ